MVKQIRQTVTTRVTKRTQRGRRQKQVAKRRQIRARPIPTLSKCAVQYLKAIENPFSGITACVPSNFNVPTYKANVWVRSTFSTGTADFGYVTVNPHWSMFLGTTGRYPVAYSTGTFAGNTVNTGVATGVSFAELNCPYGPTANAALVKARLVGCGLRIRNISPALNRGGYSLMSESPGHATFAGQNLLGFGAISQTGPADTSGEWTSVTWHPVDEDEHDFLSIDDLGNYTSSAFPFSLGAVAVAPAGTPQTYQFEIYSVVEYLGTAVRGTSPNESDPVGMARVQNSSNTVSSRKPTIGALEPVVQSELWKATVAGLATIGAAGVSAGSNYIAGRIRQSSSIRPPLMIEELD